MIVPYLRRFAALISAILFLVTTIIGFLVEVLWIRANSGVTVAANFPWTYYFLHNIESVAMGISGVIFFGVPTIIFLCSNGMIFGAALGEALVRGATMTQLIRSFAPNGIFEIPAMILAGEIGLYGLSIYQHPRIKFIAIVARILIVLILLVLAAFAESFLSKPI